MAGLAGALVVNIGTLSAAWIEAMLRAGRTVLARGTPLVLDPVGVGATSFRTVTARRLLQETPPSIVRGNASEIRTVAKGSGSTKGVDADFADAVREDNLDEGVAFVKALAKLTDTVIAMTGAIDLVGNAETVYIIRNGHPLMSKITGTGCMLTAVTAAFCGANPDDILEAAAAAVTAMGLCGERAAARLSAINGGTSTLRTFLIDEMSLLDEDTLSGGAKVEIR
jgi:hydroxyethylthiazole kinase